MLYLSRIKKVVSELARRVGRDQSGQGMTEYILIVALVAVASISVVGIFGSNIQSLFQMAANSLAGEQVDTSKLVKSTKTPSKGISDLSSSP